MARRHVSSAPTAAPKPDHQPLAGVPLGFLVFTILCTGSGIIMLEVLGARMAGPIFGVSLYIWTALIAVTLAALSLGYYLGGILADRRPYPSALYGIILAAGIWIAFLPILDAPVLIAAYEMFQGEWRIRGGVLLGALVLFGPPLTLLGMVSPYAIKLALADLSRTGQTAGILYAISTVGSVLGTILAGYFLIPLIGIDNTLLAITLLIMLPALLWFVFGKRWVAVIVSTLAVVVGLASAWTALGQPALPLGYQVIDKVDSQYGQLKILDMNDSVRPTRWLLLEGTAQTGMYKDSNELVSSYIATMVDFLGVHPPQGRRALLVGLGGGALVKPMKELGYELDVVEIDPKVAEWAAKYFGANPALYRLITEDGRAYMRGAGEKYDVVMLDVFSGGGQPFHLFSQESFGDIANILSPDGIVGLNVIAFPQGENAIMPQSLLRTASAVFANAMAFVGDPGEAMDEIQNILMFFSPSPFGTPNSVENESEAANRLEERILPLDASKGRLIRDDLNPVDRWTEKVNEAWRRRLFESLGAEVLAY